MTHVICSECILETQFPARETEVDGTPQSQPLPTDGPVLDMGVAGWLDYPVHCLESSQEHPGHPDGS